LVTQTILIIYDGVGGMVFEVFLLLPLASTHSSPSTYAVPQSSEKLQVFATSSYWPNCTWWCPHSQITY